MHSKESRVDTSMYLMVSGQKDIPITTRLLMLAKNILIYFIGSATSPSDYILLKQYFNKLNTLPQGTIKRLQIKLNFVVIAQEQFKKQWFLQLLATCCCNLQKCCNYLAI